MSVKVYEGEDLESLIEKAKEELGEIDILYYEVEKRGGLLPFFRKRRYRLFVTPKEEECRQPSVQQEQVTKELEELRRLVESLKESVSKAASSAPPPPPPRGDGGSSVVFEELLVEFTGDALELVKKLLEKGVEPEVAKAIVEKSCGLDIETEKMDLNTATFREAVFSGVKELISFTGGFKVEPQSGEPKLIAFLGPTGVGKTTNLFKVASKFVIEQDLKVGVITTDTFKVGAVQQARVYASILNVPFFVATDQKKFKEILASVENLDVVLIDTVGRSHYDYWRLGEIKAILSGASLPIEYTLLISCNYDTKEALEVVKRYRGFFPVSSLFFTKVDESSRPGVMVNVPYYTELPLAYLSTGQRVPEDIKLLTPEVVTDYLVGS
ncbi:flagellar biosynthesis protein FlhF [Thermovibrio ammonificans]|jgi:flagellar biosynthesis protein FlhF